MGTFPDGLSVPTARLLGLGDWGGSSAGKILAYYIQSPKFDPQQRAWWYLAAIPELQRWRLNHKFKVILSLESRRPYSKGVGMLERELEGKASITFIHQ